MSLRSEKVSISARLDGYTLAVNDLQVVPDGITNVPVVVDQARADGEQRTKLEALLAAIKGAPESAEQADASAQALRNLDPALLNDSDRQSLAIEGNAAVARLEQLCGPDDFPTDAEVREITAVTRILQLMHEKQLLDDEKWRGVLKTVKSRVPQVLKQLEIKSGNL